MKLREERFCLAFIQVFCPLMSFCFIRADRVMRFILRLFCAFYAFSDSAMNYFQPCSAQSVALLLAATKITSGKAGVGFRLPPIPRDESTHLPIGSTGPVPTRGVPGAFTWAFVSLAREPQCGVAVHFVSHLSFRIRGIGVDPSTV